MELLCVAGLWVHQEDFRLERSHLQTMGIVSWHLGHLEELLVQLSPLSPTLVLPTSLID